MGRIHIHEIEVHMTEDREKVEAFLNSLKGEVVAVIPNVHVPWGGNFGGGIDFLWIVEHETDSSGEVQ